MNLRSQASSSLSARIVQYLCDRGYAQAEIARMLSVSPGVVSLVKSKERSLTIPLLERLAEAMNVPLGALLIDVTAVQSRRKDVNELMVASARIIHMADKAKAAMRRKKSATK